MLRTVSIAGAASGKMTCMIERQASQRATGVAAGAGAARGRGAAAPAADAAPAAAPAAPSSAPPARATARARRVDTYWGSTRTALYIMLSSGYYDKTYL